MLLALPMSWCIIGVIGVVVEYVVVAGNERYDIQYCYIGCSFFDVVICVCASDYVVVNVCIVYVGVVVAVVVLLVVLLWMMCMMVCCDPWCCWLWWYCVVLSVLMVPMWVVLLLL